MSHNTRTHKPVPSRDRTRSRLGTGKGPLRVIVCLITLWSFLFTAVPPCYALAVRTWAERELLDVPEDRTFEFAALLVEAREDGVALVLEYRASAKDELRRVAFEPPAWTPRALDSHEIAQAGALRVAVAFGDNGRTVTACKRVPPGAAAVGMAVNAGTANSFKAEIGLLTVWRIHARPADIISELAKKIKDRLKIEIFISKDESSLRAPAWSIMELILLNAWAGDTLIVEAIPIAGESEVKSEQYAKKALTLMLELLDDYAAMDWPSHDEDNIHIEKYCAKVDEIRKDIDSAPTPAADAPAAAPAPHARRPRPREHLPTLENPLPDAIIIHPESKKHQLTNRAKKSAGRGIGRTDSPAEAPMLPAEQTDYLRERNLERNYEQLNSRYDGKIDEAIEEMSSMIKERPVRILFIGVERGNEAIDTKRKFGDKVDVHAINKKSGEFYDIEYYVDRIRGLPQAEQGLAVKAFRGVRQNLKIADLDKGVPGYENRFDIIVFGDTSTRYIRDKIGIINKLLEFAASEEAHTFFETGFTNVEKGPEANSQAYYGETYFKEYLSRHNSNVESLIDSGFAHIQKRRGGRYLIPFDFVRAHKFEGPGFTFQDSFYCESRTDDPRFLLTAPAAGGGTGRTKTSATMVERLEKRYGEELTRGSAHLEVAFCKYPRPNSLKFAHMTFGRPGEVIPEINALYCNYVIVFKRGQKRAAAVIHTNVDSIQFAEDALKKACNALDVSLDDQEHIRENVVVRIARPAKNPLSILVESAFTQACGSLGLPQLETDIDESWSQNKCSLVVDEGLFLVLGQSAQSGGLEIIHSLNLFESAPPAAPAQLPAPNPAESAV